MYFLQIFLSCSVGCRVSCVSVSVSGSVSVTVPRGASSGQRLRLRGKGIKDAKGRSGDQIVRLKIVLPKRIDSEMEDLARRWRDKAGFDPRAEMRRMT